MIAKRDDFGRLGVSDEVLVENGIGAMLALCLSEAALMKMLGCDTSEAQIFRENAAADVARIRQILNGANWA